MGKIIKKTRLCDFCGLDMPVRIWYFGSLIFPAGTEIDLFTEFFENPEWGACDKCNELIIRQDVVGLVGSNPHIMEKDRSYWIKLYTSLLANFTRN